MSYMTPPAVDPRLTCDDYVNSKCMHCGAEHWYIKTFYDDGLYHEWCYCRVCSKSSLNIDAEAGRPVKVTMNIEGVNLVSVKVGGENYERY